MEINNPNEEIVKRKHIHTMHLLTRMRHILYICIDMEGCPWHIIQWKKLALEHCTCIIPCIQKEMCICTTAHIYIPIHTQIYNAYIMQELDLIEKSSGKPTQLSASVIRIGDWSLVMGRFSYCLLTFLYHFNFCE